MRYGRRSDSSVTGQLGYRLFVEGPWTKGRNLLMWHCAKSRFEIRPTDLDCPSGSGPELWPRCNSPMSDSPVRTTFSMTDRKARTYGRANIFSAVAGTRKSQGICLRWAGSQSERTLKMANESNDQKKATTGTAQQQSKPVQHAGQQQKQAAPHDEKSCTNPNHHHGKDANVAASKPNPGGKPTR